MLALGLLLAARGAAQLLINPSFESDRVEGNVDSRNFSPLTGWTLSTTPPDLTNSSLAADGTQYLVLFAQGNASAVQEFISQTITDTPGQLYTVSFQLRGGSQNNWAGSNYSDFYGNWLSYSADSYNSWTGTSAGLTFQARVNGVGALSVVDPGTAQWNLEQFSFTGTGSDTLTFQNLGDSYAVANYTALSIDGLSVQAVPEPDSLLLAMGGLGLLVAGRARWAQRSNRG